MSILTLSRDGRRGTERGKREEEDEEKGDTGGTLSRKYHL